MTPQCANCGGREGVVIVPVLERRATYSSPAEYADVLICSACLESPAPDDAYERAAAGYDGEGRDWR